MNKKFAVLIGIDDYSSIGIRGLEGAVNDVDDVEEWLETSSLLKWRIKRLTTKAGDHSPTYANIQSELEKLEKESKPGDFIFVHYSGHGSRRESKLDSRKRRGVVDEVLVFQRGYMRDFEFGAILDRLAEERTVFLVLDCCFSAGQDRDEDDPENDVGCRLTTGNLTQLDEHDTDPRILDQAENADESWWDRPRNYTLLAASGRNQKARETRGKNGYRNGMLTYFALNALTELYRTDGPFTYQALLHLVRIDIDQRLEEENSERKQDPELFG